MRTACLRFRLKPHNSLARRKGQLAAPTLSRPPSIIRYRPVVEQASFAPPSHAKELTHLPQSGSKRHALQNRLLECGRLASAFVSNNVTPSDVEKGSLLPQPFHVPPALIRSDIVVVEQASFDSSQSRQRTHPSPPKRQQAARTPKSSLGVRTACLRFRLK